MEQQKSQQTISNGVNACSNTLDKLGFTSEFKVVKNGLQSLATDHLYYPPEIKIVRLYQFSAKNNNEDNATIYAIETRNGERGKLKHTYGAKINVDVINLVKAIDSKIL